MLSACSHVSVIKIWSGTNAENCSVKKSMNLLAMQRALNKMAKNNLLEAYRGVKSFGRSCYCRECLFVRPTL